MDSQFARSEALIGKEAQERLKNSRVILFGVGGVGSFAAELLARSGVGGLTLVDSDAVCLTNLNRQLGALHSTVGRPKTQVFEQRIRDINPCCRVETVSSFYLPENADEISLEGYDYIADAIDTVSAKLELAVRAKKAGVPIISCMGTGNKLEPTLLRVSDIYKTEGCPLCRVMRRELRARSVEALKVVWSPETPRKPLAPVDGGSEGRHAPASMAFVPASAGILMAKEIITDLIGDLL